MTIGSRVRAARHREKLSLAQLAARSGLTKGFLSQVESGTSRPSIESLERVARALSVAPAELLETDARYTVQSGMNDSLRLISAVPVRRGVRLEQAPVDGLGSRAYHISLSPGQLLRLTPNRPGTLVCHIARGRVLIHAGSRAVVLLAGDFAAVSVGEFGGLTIESSGGREAVFVLVTSAACPAPAGVDASERSSAPGVSRADAGGPLRLVSLRAGRGSQFGT